VITFAFASDGKSLATSAWERGTHVYDLSGAPRERAFLQGHGALVASAAFFDGGRKLATLASPFLDIDNPPRTCQLWIWDLAGGRTLHEWTLPTILHMVGAAPDGRHLAAVSDEGLVYIFRLASGSGKK